MDIQASEKIGVTCGPTRSLQPTPDGALSSAFADHFIGPAWLSSRPITHETHSEDSVGGVNPGPIRQAFLPDWRAGDGVRWHCVDFQRVSRATVCLAGFSLYSQFTSTESIKDGFPMMTWSNKPAAGNAGIGSQLAVEHHWPGVPEPERWAEERACTI